ncbi:MAG: DUF945 family protein, partial [Gammaproteobacteria bacterium]|nr:DUF945 family protein [Gammaproteobacteria bacterium]
LPLPIAMQVIGLQDKQLTAQAFNAKLTELGLTPDVATIITQAYAQEKAQEAAMKTAQQSSPADLKKAAMDKWISQGYLIPDNSDYKLELTLENGVIKINGKIPPEPKELLEPPHPSAPVSPAVTPVPVPSPAKPAVNTSVTH